jgi:hypothetical protein
MPKKIECNKIKRMKETIRDFEKRLFTKIEEPDIQIKAINILKIT